MDIKTLKLNTILEYEFILKHKNLKEYCENYVKYKDVLTNKYDLYTLVYINGKYSDFTEIQSYSLNNNDELYMYDLRFLMLLHNDYVLVVLFRD